MACESLHSSQCRSFGLREHYLHHCGLQKEIRERFGPLDAIRSVLSLVHKRIQILGFPLLGCLSLFYFLCQTSFDVIREEGSNDGIGLGSLEDQVLVSLLNKSIIQKEEDRHNHEGHCDYYGKLSSKERNVRDHGFRPATSPSQNSRQCE